MDNIPVVTTENVDTVLELESELQQMVEEMLRSVPISQSNPRFSSPQGAAGPNNEYMVLFQSLRDIMMMYNSNISEYNNNIGTSLQLMQTILGERNRPRPVPVPVHTSQPEPSTFPARNNVAGQRPNDHLFSYVLYRPTIRNQDAATMRHFLQNIVVRPTPEQIETSTHLVIFQPNMENINTSCPITLNDFQEGDIVRQIRHCRHAFHEESIQNWFQRNVRCPVCRYDIRDYTVSTGQHPPIITEPSPEEPIQGEPSPSTTTAPIDPQYQSLLQEISRNFASEVNNILSGNFPSDAVDASQNLVFEFQVETTR
jgi:hypothetical protein